MPKEMLVGVVCLFCLWVWFVFFLVCGVFCLVGRVFFLFGDFFFCAAGFVFLHII